MKPRGKSCRADQPRRIFDEGVVVQNANQLSFNVGHAVERVHQQPTRTFIQRKRHGVDSQITAAQIFNNGCRSNNRRLAGFLIALNPRHADFRADVPWQGQIKRLGVVIGSDDPRPCLFQVLLKFYGISLNGEVEVADIKSADDVADGSARQINVHPGVFGYPLD